MICLSIVYSTSYFNYIRSFGERQLFLLTFKFGISKSLRIVSTIYSDQINYALDQAVITVTQLALSDAFWWIVRFWVPLYL